MALHRSEGHTGDVNPTPHKIAFHFCHFHHLVSLWPPRLGKQTKPASLLHKKNQGRCFHHSIHPYHRPGGWSPSGTGRGCAHYTRVLLQMGPLFSGVSRAWEHTASFAQSYWAQKYAAANVCCFQDANLDLRAGCIPAMHNIFPFYVMMGWTIRFCCVKCATARCYICVSCPMTPCIPQKQRQKEANHRRSICQKHMHQPGSRSVLPICLWCRSCIAAGCLREIWAAASMFMETSTCVHAHEFKDRWFWWALLLIVLQLLPLSYK